MPAFYLEYLYWLPNSRNITILGPSGESHRSTRVLCKYNLVQLLKSLSPL